MLNNASCAFIVWVMDIWGSFITIQDCVVSITVKKSTNDCFIRTKVLCQIVTVREWELKRRNGFTNDISSFSN